MQVQTLKTTSRALSTALAGLIALTVACAPPTASGDAGPTADAGHGDAGLNDAGAMDAGPTGVLGAAVDWQPCQLVSYPSGPLDGNMAATCAQVRAPLNWDAVDDGQEVSLFVKRIDPPEPATSELWMVNGGPGGDTVTFERLLRGLIPAWGNVRVYLTEARGAGRSSRLSCPDAEAFGSPGNEAIVDEEWDACFAALDAQWGDGLAAFNTTNTARDIAFLAARFQEHTADGPVPVFAYGVSYGTYWLNRVLQLESHPFSGMIMDSMVNAELPQLSHIDAWHDRIGRELLTRCADDALCGEKFGPDPVARAEAVMASLEDGHCPELAIATESDTRALFRVMMGAMLSSGQLRGMIPALLYRAERCSAADVTALQNAMVVLFGAADTPRTEAQGLFSRILAMHVVLSEMWNADDAETAMLIADAETALMGKNIVPNFGAMRDRWPTYTPDAFDGAWAQTDLPLLMMNGSLDPSTPLARAEVAADVYTLPTQTFVPMADMAHGTAFSSLIQGRNTTCGILLMSQFLRAPQSTLDTSCQDELAIDPFAVRGQVVQAVFGTSDLYE